MEANEYQSLCWQTAAPFYKAEVDVESHQLLQLCTMTLALCGEAGELGNKLKKFIECGNGIDHNAREILTDELGDVAWYIAGVAKLLGISLEDVLRLNISKLRKRYPDGFTDRIGLRR